MELKVTQIGNSLGVVLPKELLSQLHVGKGDKIFVANSPDGIVLSSFDPELSEQMNRADGIIRRYRNTLNELAK